MRGSVLREGPAQVPRSVGLGYRPEARLVPSGEILRPFYKPTDEQHTFGPRPAELSTGSVSQGILAGLVAAATVAALALAILALGWDVRW